MLNITLRTNDNVLLYDRTTGKLVGVLSCARILPDTDVGQVDMQFRVSDSLLVFREALVKRNTDDLSTCPPSLMQRFAKGQTDLPAAEVGKVTHA